MAYLCVVLVIFVMILDKGCYGVFSSDNVRVFLDNSSSDFSFNHMYFSVNASTLVVAGNDFLYTINVTSGEHVQTRASEVAEPQGYTTTMLIPYDDSSVMTCANYSKECLTGSAPCGNNDVKCLTRSVTNMSDYSMTDMMSFSTPDAAAFIVPFDGNDFMFVGCPHVSIHHRRCAKAGISWYKIPSYSEDKVTAFKDKEATPIITTKYVNAFPVGKFRFFFSVQNVTSDKKLVSRVAHICQVANTDITKKTYVDMELRCGDLSVLVAVETVTVGNTSIIVAAFTNGTVSTLCAYTLDQLKER